MVTCCGGYRSGAKAPVKRYKMLVSDVFPRNQEVNNRKISKLCDYAQKNPQSIPKIAQILEQRAFKELRAEKYGHVTCAMKAFSKMLHACRTDISAFAQTVLTLVRTLLDHREDDMRVLGAQTLYEFEVVQNDAAYMLQLDSLVPRVCDLTRQTGERRKKLKLVGLRCLLEMVRLMERTSQLSAAMDEIVTTILDNIDVSSGMDGEHKEKGKFKREGLHAVANLAHRVGMDDFAAKAQKQADTPGDVSRDALRALGRLAREASTARRVLEPMLRFMDKYKHWTDGSGIAESAVKWLQDSHADGSYLLISVLVLHCHSKEVQDNPQVKAAVVRQIAKVTERSKVNISSAVPVALRDLIRHYRASVEASPDENLRPVEESQLLDAITDCITVLARKIGDPWPLMEILAGILEKLPQSPLQAQACLKAVLVTAHAISHLPPSEKMRHLAPAFPQACLHQLVSAMLVPDAKVRETVHTVFGVLITRRSMPMKQRSFKSTSIAAQAATHFAGRLKGNWKDLMHNTPRGRGSAGNEDDLSNQASTSGSGFGGVHRSFTIAGQDNEDEFQPAVSQLDTSNDLNDGVRASFEIDSAVRSMQEQSQSSDQHNRQFFSVVTEPVGHAKRPSMEAMPVMRVESVAVGRDKGHKEHEKDREKGETSKQHRWKSLAASLPASNDAGLLKNSQAGLLLSALWLQALMTDNQPGNYASLVTTFNLVLTYSRTKTILRAVPLALLIRQRALFPPESAELPAFRCRSLLAVSHAMLRCVARHYAVPPVVATKEEADMLQVCPYLIATEKGMEPSPAASESRSGYGGADDAAKADALMEKIRSGDNEAHASFAVTTIIDALCTTVSLQKEFGEDNLQKALFQPFEPDDSYILRRPLSAANRLPSSSAFPAPGRLSSGNLESLGYADKSAGLVLLPASEILNQSKAGMPLTETSSPVVSPMAGTSYTEMLEKVTTFGTTYRETLQTVLHGAPPARAVKENGHADHTLLPIRTKVLTDVRPQTITTHDAETLRSQGNGEEESSPTSSYHSADEASPTGSTRSDRWNQLKIVPPLQETSLADISSLNNNSRMSTPPDTPPSAPLPRLPPTSAYDAFRLAAGC
eukprot:jgi/Chlat1/5720/Chrsp38S05555